ncbi:protein of unknown function [Granulicella rosea]|uniref:DUF4160 domain-containing protein n=1 Tax=Granulicella rosea TaxID=474952 RepID=A0A239IRU8_9BACT|nr:protein of unknown function [Granulicella rosea]
MGSLRFDGVRFFVYVDDHPPPHVHAKYAETEAVLDLLPDSGIAISSRPFAIDPPNAKASDLKKILKVARDHEAVLRELWQSIHGGK